MSRLGWLFVVIAGVSALLGFGWVADLAYPAARIVFFVCVALAAVSFLADALERDKIPDAR